MNPTVSDTSSSRRSGSLTLPDERIERHEKRVRRHRVAAGQRIEQRRLAGVGVADERDGRDGRLLPPLAQLRAPPAHRVDFLGEDADAVTDAPAVGFEFRFAGAARADAAAQPRQAPSLEPDEPRHQVLELRELDLKLAFTRPRAPREDVENELRAIDDLAVERFFEVAQLRRRQLVVENHDIDARSSQEAASDRNLAAAEKRRGIRLGALLQHAQHDRRAGGRRQAGQFVERMLGIEVTGSAVEQTDKRRALLSIRRGRSRGRMTCHCSDFITRSHGTAPARSERRPSASNAMIVDGAPPGAGPASRIASTSGSPCATPSAEVAVGRPIDWRSSR